MTSTRKQEANRRNASKSTGPKTEAGKRVSARNAFRHGLSIASLEDPTWAPEVRSLAGSIIAEEAPPIARELAYRVAAAQIDLVRVRNARHELVSATLADEGFEPAIQTMKRNIVIQERGRLPDGSHERLMAVLSHKPAGDKRLAIVLLELADKLDRLERYERRALSRRRKAMRAFDVAARRLPAPLLRFQSLQGH